MTGWGHGETSLLVCHCEPLVRSNLHLCNEANGFASSACNDGVKEAYARETVFCLHPDQLSEYRSVYWRHQQFAAEFEHRERKSDSFTARYHITKLVYYEIGTDASSAIFREKQIKAGSRQKKMDLIHAMNPQWKDLYDELFA